MRLAPFALALLPLAACGHAGAGVTGTGSGPSRQFAVAGFTAVAATGSDDVDVRTGGGFSVRAEGDPAVLDQLRIVRDGDTLKVGRNPGWHPTVSGHAKVFVTMPRIAAAATSGSGSIAVDRVVGPDFAADGDGSGSLTIGQATGRRFAANLHGSGDLTVRSLGVTALSLAIAGSGSATLAGRTGDLQIAATGSGSVDAPGLVASNATVSVMGSGDVRARVDGSARVSLMGSGSVDLGGAARCTVARMGSGSVRCGR